MRDGKLDRAAWRHAIVASIVCGFTSPASAERAPGEPDDPTTEDPDAPRRPREPVIERAGCGGGGSRGPKTGMRATAGTLLGGPSTGGYGRFDFEVFDGSIRRPAALVGVVPFDVGGWASGRGGGGGLGSWGYVGYATPDVFGSFGCGIDWLIYDRVDGHGGVGVASPLAIANFGLSFREARFFVDARAQHRWHFGLASETQLGAGVGVMLKM